MNNEFDKVLKTLDSTVKEKLRGYAMNKQEKDVIECTILEAADLFDLDVHRKSWMMDENKQLRDRCEMLGRALNKPMVAPSESMRITDSDQGRQMLMQKMAMESSREQESSMQMFAMMVALFVGGCAGSLITYMVMR